MIGSPPAEITASCSSDPGSAVESQTDNRFHPDRFQNRGRINTVLRSPHANGNTG